MELGWGDKRGGKEALYGVVLIINVWNRCMYSCLNACSLYIVVQAEAQRSKNLTGCKLPPKRPDRLSAGDGGVQKVGLGDLYVLVLKARWR